MWYELVWRYIRDEQFHKAYMELIDTPLLSILTELFIGLPLVIISLFALYSRLTKPVVTLWTALGTWVAYEELLVYIDTDDVSLANLLGFLAIGLVALFANTYMYLLRH